MVAGELAAEVIVGGCVSLTLTVNEQLAVLPEVVEAFIAYEAAPKR